VTSDETFLLLVHGLSMGSRSAKIERMFGKLLLF